MPIIKSGKNPYSDLPLSAFWRAAVADRHPMDICSLWVPKHNIARDQRILTAGSCFAQHIGRALSRRGFNWVDAEPAPGFVPGKLRSAFNYGVFSFRTGNIYTAALFKQWMRWALLEEPVPDEAWEEDGRWFDPFRPNIEPDGFSSRDEMIASRKSTLRSIKRAISNSTVFVFTLGLTEAWVHADQGYVYPMCPGTLRGRYCPDTHSFKNFKYSEIQLDLAEAFNIIKDVNPGMRFLLTVSPVPLTATASGAHVLTATTYSKSTLRAVAGDMAERGDTDYFPSFEIITAFPFRGMFFDPNMRSVSMHGVDHVMNSFFSGLEAQFPESARVEKGEISKARESPSAEVSEGGMASDVKCEEEILAAFNRGGK